MEKKYLLLYAAVVFILGSAIALSVGFTIAPTGNVTMSGANQTFNITINNTNATFNITQVNFTLPYGFITISGTNSTNSASNLTSSSARTFNWTNSTPMVGLVPNASAAWFAFNATSPTIFDSVNNSFNFNITIVDNSGAVNYSTTASNTYNVTVQPFGAINNSTGNTSFSGTLPANATTYQSFFFNTSAVPNATSVYANLTSPSSIVHLFLFDNSSAMKAESVSGATTQSLSYNYLPSSPALWEIRVYGNSTSAISYSGAIILSTLNATNPSLAYGNLNVTGLPVTTSLNLTNKGSLSLGNVSLSSTIYRIQSFGGSGSFPFLVNINTESRIRVNLTWTGISNYSFNVYNPAGSLIMTAGNIYTLANASSAGVLELFNDTTSVTAGYWNVSVVANSGNNNYNVTVFTFDNSNWIATNVSTTSSLSSLFSNTSVQVNLTAPNTAIDGNYGGALTLTDANGGVVSVPISFNVTTPTLLVLNASNSPTLLNPFTSDTFRIDENIGATLNKTILINLTNIGTFNSSVNMTLNSTNLACTSGACSGLGFFANLTYNATSLNVTGRNSSLVQINVTYNSSFPAGTYDGWIFINSTNSNANLSSHPYPSYNITVRLNLTDKLNVIVGPIISPGGTNFLGNATYDQNSTVNFTLSYVNGTLLPTSEANALNTSNFTVWLTEGNTSYSVPTTGGLALFNGTSPLIYTVVTNVSSVNFTVPANTPGGRYSVTVQTSYTRGDAKLFSGSGSNSSLIINNTGLLPTLTHAPGTLSNGTTDYINISLKNYGPLDASGGQITVTKSGTYTTLTYSRSTCNATSGTTAVSFYLNAYNSSGCDISWKADGGSSAGTDAFWINGTGGTWFRNITAFNVSVTVPSSSPPGSNPPSSSSQPINVTPGTGTVTANITSISVGNNVIPLGFVANLYVSKLVVNANTALSNVVMVVNNLAAKPSSISAVVNGTVFNYFEVVATNMTDANVNNVTISFFVARNWISASSINISTVKLYRYANSVWNALQTTKTSEGTDYVYYDAVSPGMSTFAIAGLAQNATAGNAGPGNATGNATQQGNTTSIFGIELPGQTAGTILLVIGAVAIAVYFLLGRKQKPWATPGNRWEELRKKWS